MSYNDAMNNFVLILMCSIVAFANISTAAEVNGKDFAHDMTDRFIKGAGTQDGIEDKVIEGLIEIATPQADEKTRQIQRSAIKLLLNTDNKGINVSVNQALGLLSHEYSADSPSATINSSPQIQALSSDDPERMQALVYIFGLLEKYDKERFLIEKEIRGARYYKYWGADDREVISNINNHKRADFEGIVTRVDLERVYVKSGSKEWPGNTVERFNGLNLDGKLVPNILFHWDSDAITKPEWDASDINRISRIITSWYRNDREVLTILRQFLKTTEAINECIKGGAIYQAKSNKFLELRNSLIERNQSFQNACKQAGEALPTRIISLESEYSKMVEEYRPQHPKMLALSAAINECKSERTVFQYFEKNGLIMGNPVVCILFSETENLDNCTPKEATRLLEDVLEKKTVAWDAKVVSLINKGANPNLKSSTGLSLLHLACLWNKISSVKKLIAAGASIEARTHSGSPYYSSTPLMFGAREGNIEIVKMLLNAGASLDAKNDSGATALSYAAKNGHTNVVAYLAENGAVIDVRSTIDNDFCQKSISNNDPRRYTFGRPTPLLLAAYNGDAEMVRLLITLGANPNEEVLYGRTHQPANALTLAIVRAVYGNDEPSSYVKTINMLIKAKTERVYIMDEVEGWQRLLEIQLTKSRVYFSESQKTAIKEIKTLLEKDQ